MLTGEAKVNTGEVIVSPESLQVAIRVACPELIFVGNTMFPEKSPLIFVERFVNKGALDPFCQMAKFTVLLAPADPHELEALVVPPIFGNRVPMLNELFRANAFAKKGKRAMEIDIIIFFI